MLFCNTDVATDVREKDPIDHLNNTLSVRRKEGFDVMSYHMPRIFIQLEYGVAVPSFFLFRSF